jgi:hypothetical protein
MNKLASILAIALLLPLGAAPVQARDVDIGVTISGELQPGVYGQVNIGTVPNYALVYPQPVVVTAPPAYAVPVHAAYLHVPPGHAKHWNKHCHKYNACSRPVYFVAPPQHHGHPPAPPHAHQHPGKGHGKDHGKGHGHGNGKHKGHH